MKTSSRPRNERCQIVKGWILIATIVGSVILPTSASAWSHGHETISAAALSAQPQPLRDLWSQPYQLPDDDKGPRAISEYLTLYEFWAATPDHFAAKVDKGIYDDFLYYEGKWLWHYFTMSDEENRARVQRGAKWYFEQIAKAFREGRAADAARYAGGFAHALEDRSCPVHAWDGYSEQREAVEAKYASFGLQDLDKNFPSGQAGASQIWWADDRSMTVDLTGYQPRLLGGTPEEAAVETAKRFEAICEYTRKACSENPNVPGTFLNEHLKDKWYGPTHDHESGPATTALLSKMAQNSAQLVADVFYTGYQLGQ